MQGTTCLSAAERTWTYLERFHGLLPESQGWNLAATVLYVPYSLDGGEGLGREDMESAAAFAENVEPYA